MSFGQVFLYDILGDDTLQLVGMLNVLVYTLHGLEVELGSVIIKFSFLFFRALARDSTNYMSQIGIYHIYNGQLDPVLYIF